MDDIRKINSMQFYYLWRNFALSLLCVVVTIVATHMLPFFMAPVVSFFICAVLYTLIVNNESNDQPGCMVVVQTVFYCIMGYNFVAISLVIISFWDIQSFPRELIFFNDPFLPALIMMPVSFVVSLLVCMFKKSMPACRRCRINHGSVHERGYYGIVSSKETTLQLRSMVPLFGVLTVIVWWYYLDSYVDVNQNARDWYVFVWVVVLLMILDEVFFMVRYFNLFLDLEENGELITQEELRDMSATTFLRFYVICGESIYLIGSNETPVRSGDVVIDTPFVTKRLVEGISPAEIRRIAEDITGVRGGELKLFYGRKIQGIEKCFVLRYFYFLDCDQSDCPVLKSPGEWLQFRDVKRIYSREPMRMSVNVLADISRLSTIILTAKTYDENGYRKNPIKSYRQNITLADVRNSNIDMQDDKWIRIAAFNSDSRFFRVKKFFRNLMGRWGSKSGDNC